MEGGGRGGSPEEQVAGEDGNRNLSESGKARADSKQRKLKTAFGY